MAVRHCMFFFIISLVSVVGKAQKAASDTLETARYLANNKQLEKAADILKTYHQNHPDDVSAIRLYAQVAYWLGDNKTALGLFETHLDNTNKGYQPELMLDYSRMLFQLYLLRKAKALLKTYVQKDATNVEANNMMGTILYWQGNCDGAMVYFNKVLKQYPTNDWAKKYSKEIKEIIAPCIKFHSGYSDDTQPLKLLDLGLEYGSHQNMRLGETVGFEMQNFKTNGFNKNAYNLNAGVNYFLPVTKTNLAFSVGAYKTIAKDTTRFTTNLLLSQQLSKYVSFALQAGRLPYTNTIMGAEAATMEDRLQATIGYDNPKVLMGKTGYVLDRFDDANSVQTAYSWVLSPNIKASIFSFNFGYSFNYANAKESRYTSTKSLAEIIAGYATNTTITGIYSPYFTPLNQQVHSLLANVAVKPTSKITVGVNSSIGVSAIASNPYLYLGKVGGATAISSGVSDTHFNPLKINTNISYAIGKQLSLQLGYTYMKTFFYNSNTAFLDLKYLFYNGK